MKLALVFSCILAASGCAMSVEPNPADCDPGNTAGAAGATDEPEPQPIRPKKPPTHDANTPKK